MRRFASIVIITKERITMARLPKIALHRINLLNAAREYYTNHALPTSHSVTNSKVCEMRQVLDLDVSDADVWGIVDTLHQENEERILTALKDALTEAEAFGLTVHNGVLTVEDFPDSELEHDKMRQIFRAAMENKDYTMAYEYAEQVIEDYS